MEGARATKDRASTAQEDRKFQELILYLSSICANDETYGSVKLNKLLFNIDFQAYSDLGHSITGQEYAKRQQGPCPRRLLAVREQLEAAGALRMEETQFRGYLQKRPVAQREPDLSFFTDEERELIDGVVDHWWGATGTTMSDTSHKFVGWQLAREGETIPYEVALVQVMRPTREEIEWARGLEPQAKAYLLRKAV